MSKFSEQRERLERAYKIANRHYQRSLAELADARFYESEARDESGWQWIVSELREQQPDQAAEVIASRRKHGDRSSFNDRSKQNAIARHNRALIKLSKVKERVKQHDKKSTSSLLKLYNYLDSIGEPVV